MDRMIRPKMTVLPASALLPKHLTHKVIKKQPYYYNDPQQGKPPDGTFRAGTKVRLLEHDGGPMCRVADKKGVCVMTAFDGLLLISESDAG